MNQLSLEDAKFLKKHFHKLTNLQKIRDGIIKPESPKGKRLLSVLAGKLLPKTQYERAFLHWTEMNEPNLFEYISEKIRASCHRGSEGSKGSQASHWSQGV